MLVDDDDMQLEREQSTTNEAAITFEHHTVTIQTAIKNPRSNGEF
ncbi:MAG: hypothetical protein ACKVI4_02990 [Actinomycetales bacterium]